MALLHYLKNRQFLKNYKSFNCYVVLLDNFQISSTYRNSVFFIININDNLINTEPYFSNSTFNVEEYNNKNVIGLLDIKNNFYLIKKNN